MTELKLSEIRDTHTPTHVIELFAIGKYYDKNAMLKYKKKKSRIKYIMEPPYYRVLFESYK